MTPSEPAILSFHDVRRLDVAHARRISRGLRTRMMGMAAKDDRLALARPGALEIGNCVLCARGGSRDAEERQREDKTSHRFPPVLIRRNIIHFGTYSVNEADKTRRISPHLLSTRRERY